jgi:hypothetical protein
MHPHVTTQQLKKNNGAGKSALVSRIVKLARTEGPLGSLRTAWRLALHKAHHYLYDKSFERYEAVPTSTCVHIPNLDFDEELRRHSREYLATPRLLIHQAIKLIPEPLDRFTFIDIGSGLGRPMLVAGEYDFKAVTGYELSPSLHAGALANIEQSRKALHLTTSMASVNGNALEAEWPEGSRVFFLFNPFDREFMQRFLDRVNATSSGGTRQYLVFLNLKHPELLARYPLQACTRRLAGRLIWRLISPYPLLIYRYDAWSPSGLLSA